MITSNQTNLTVSSGVVCVNPGVVITGNIAISNNATLCNQGTLNTTAITIGTAQSGNITNYGTITSDLLQFGTNATGTFHNYGSVVVKDLYLGSHNGYNVNYTNHPGSTLVVNCSAYLLAGQYTFNSPATFNCPIYFNGSNSTTTWNINANISTTNTIFTGAGNGNTVNVNAAATLTCHSWIINDDAVINNNGFIQMPGDLTIQASSGEVVQFNQNNLLNIKGTSSSGGLAVQAISGTVNFLNNGVTSVQNRIIFQGGTLQLNGYNMFCNSLYFQSGANVMTNLACGGRINVSGTSILQLSTFGSGCDMCDSGGNWDANQGTFNGTLCVCNGIGTQGTYLTFAPSNNCNPCPVDPISGLTSLCVGSSITLSNTTAGGVWTTSNSAVASISATGVVTGLTAGTATITYTVTTNGCTNSATSTLTISSISGAPITGATSLCVGATTTLANTNPNGVWTTSNSAVASVSPSGLITGLTAGTAIITYTVTANGCSSASTAPVTVNALPTVGAISGTTNGCVGSTITLSNTTSGGVWTTSNSAVASVSAAGVVTGLAAGTATITYTVTTNGCTNSATSTLTISSTSGAPITGATSLCVGATTTLANTNPNGVWTTSNSAVASVSPSGLVTGLTAGTAIVTYTVTANGCSSVSTATVTVNALPTVGAITGTTNGCVGSSITLSNTTAGGVWTTSNPAVASVSTAGVVTGIAAGTTTITYTVTTNGCTNSATSTLTISSISGAPITGATSLCVGATTTLANTNPNGAWTTSNPAVASVSPSGLVTGLTAGTAIITYTVTANGCSSASTSPVTVNALPTVGVISGTTNGCVGSTITLSNTTSGGVWTTSNSAVASVSAAGVVTGLAAGTATITYTVTTNGCTNSATSTLTISSISGAPITGATSLCVGATTTLANTNPNGVWTTSNSAVASVSPSGLVTGIAAGTATITYTVTANGCSSASTSLVTVNALPTVGAITGTTNGCVGSSITLSNTTPGGVWTTSNSTVASISATGVVTGIAAGTTTITYTVTANGCTNTATSTLTISSTSGAPITGATSLCVGATTTLANTNPNGVWTTSNSAVASVSPSGLVTGIAAGTATITYTVTANGCSSSSSIPMTVFSNPTLQLDLSETSICLGDSIMVSINNPSGLFVNWLSPASMNSSLATQMYYPQGTTNFVAEITNSSNCVSTVMASVTVHPLPILTITPEQTICIGQEASITVDGAETYIWSPQGSNSTSVFSPVSNTVYSVIGMTNFGCSATVSTTIFVTEGPIAAFSSNNISVSSDNTNVLFTNLSSGATSSYIQFSNAGGSILFNSSIQHLFPSISGNYEVILLVEDSYGCTDSAMIVIQVYEDGNCFVPNTFTPDGEQFNNVFMPVFTPGFEPQNFEFTIFNRWGELIFESNNPAYGWDGYDKNGLCQDGTYTWTIRFEKSFVDNNIFLTGHVNLLR